jgi:hypothetical protein
MIVSSAVNQPQEEHRLSTPRLHVRETLNTSIIGSSPEQALDVFSGREFGAGPNSLPPIQPLS